MVVGRDAVSPRAVLEGRVDDRDVGKRAGRAIGVVARHRVGPRHPARPVDRRERLIGVVVARALAAADGAVEDRLELVSPGLDVDLVDVGGLARRGGRPLVVAVGKRRAQQRAEVPVIGRVLADRVVNEGQLALVVVAERELVVAAALADEPAAQLGPSRLPAVAGIGMPAALKTRLAERVGRTGGHGLALGGAKALALDGVGAGQPAEVVVERAILHHQDHEMVDLDVARAR